MEAVFDEAAAPPGANAGGAGDGIEIGCAEGGDFGALVEYARGLEDKPAEAAFEEAAALHGADIDGVAAAAVSKVLVQKPICRMRQAAKRCVLSPKQHLVEDSLVVHKTTSPALTS